jgi:hypothetical protein
VVWTEHTPSLKSATNVPECAYTGYARIALGTGGASCSTRPRADPPPTAPRSTSATNSGGSSENVAGWATYDALTTGNLLEFGLLTTAPS